MQRDIEQRNPWEKVYFSPTVSTRISNSSKKLLSTKQDIGKKSKEWMERIPELCNEAISSSANASSHLKTNELHARCAAFDQVKVSLFALEDILNCEENQELRETLLGLRHLAEQKIVRSRIYLEPTPLEEAIAILEQIKRSWREHYELENCKLPPSE